ncbi:MAG: cytochrome c oxidase subunit 3 [Actinomycetota bacterium]|jgi:cytochrome c oxidase subunit 3
MLALPPAPAPAARRQLFVGASLAAAAGAMLVGGMLAMWLRFRNDAIAATGHWVPEKITIPEVASNIMLLGFVGICVFGQWAVYAARRDDKQHVGVALGLTALLGLAIINAQVAVYVQMALPIVDKTGSGYGVMFYAVTGTMLALIIVGMVFSFVTAFRYLGGRSNEREIVTAHAIYWYFIAVAFSMLWFVVYVTK